MGLVRDAGSFSKRQAVGRVNSLRGGESGAICSRGCFFYKDVGRTLTLYFNSNSGFHLGRTNKESNSKKSSARLQDCKTLSFSPSLHACVVQYIVLYKILKNHVKTGRVSVRSRESDRIPII